MGVSVVVTDTKQVEEIRQREMDITKEKIQRILATGARVILTTKVLPMFDWFATLVFDWVSWQYFTGHSHIWLDWLTDTLIYFTDPLTHMTD